MHYRTTIIAFIALGMIALQACKSDSTSVTPRTGTITQADLDKATLVLDTGIVGDPFNSFTTDAQTTQHKLRDLFGSIAKTTTVSEGDILVRKAYYISSTTNPKRDSVLNFVIMVKREPGYFGQGDDWEYIKIPYDKTVDYSAHPFGMLPADTAKSTLPDSTKTNLRGRLQTQCATCHSTATGADFLFSR